MQESASNIGYTVGENTSDRFQFVISVDTPVKKWDYVTIMYGGSKILGRIERIVSRSELLNDSMDFSSIQKYVESNIMDQVCICQARTLGLFDGGKLKQSRELLRPGLKVYSAESSLLQKAFGYPGDDAIEIGYLGDRQDVKISVSANGLRRHLAIVAQTGAGKSHTAGVIMEELLRKGASIIVLDSHADYVFMKSGGTANPYSRFIRTFRTPLSTGRYDLAGKGIVEEFTLRFQDLTIEDVTGIMNIRENWTNLANIVENAMKSMTGKGDFADFLNALENLPAGDRRKIDGRIKFLKKIRGIFSDATTGRSDYLAPGQMSILDLSGMDQFMANYFSYRVVNEIYESKLSSAYRYPVFIFVEEAHNFVPPGSVTQISQIIKKIASEGRKFGIFLVVITQRPGKIDQDVLSQCNSEIILRITNPLDQKAIIESGESVGESVMSDLPSLDIGEGILLGEFVRMPVIVKIRERETIEGGGDVDIVTLLKESLQERKKKNSADSVRGDISSVMGD
ncbi:MAG: ATP-binding protein [Thermoplasmataceae archaeon]